MLLLLFYFHLYLVHGSSVSMEARLKTEQLSNQVLIQSGGRVFSLYYIVFETVLASYPVGARGSEPRE